MYFCHGAIFSSLLVRKLDQEATMNWCKTVLVSSYILVVQNIAFQNIAFAEGVNNLLSPAAFSTENDQALLSEQEWIKLNMFARSASILPITQESMRKRFNMNSYVAFDGVYQSLLSNYQNIHQISSQWLGESGYQNKMISLVENLVTYSHKINDNSYGMIHQAQLMVRAADNFDDTAFEQAKADLLAILEVMLKVANQYYQNADSLGNGLTDFINALDSQMRNLDKLQAANQGILENDGSEASKDIDELKRRIDELNQEYRKWVTVAATTPTYAWIFPFGTIAAISTASTGSAKAVALKNQIQSITDDVTVMREQMAQDQAIYLSWSIATYSIEKIRESSRSTLSSQQRLRGGWALIASQLDSIIQGIADVNSDDVLNDPDNFIAAYITESEIEKLKLRWKNIGEEGEKWLVNSDVAGVSSAQFSAPIQISLADELGIVYSTVITENSSGLSWPTYDYQQATDLCQEQGMRLPTKFELEQLQAWFEQYEEIDTSVWPTGIHYWSSTIDPSGRYYTVNIKGGDSKLYPHGHQYVACTAGEILNPPTPPVPQISDEFSLPLTKEEADKEGYVYTGFRSEVDFGPNWATFTYDQAKTMCEERGMRLPNSDEFATFSVVGGVDWPSHRMYWTHNNPQHFNWDYAMYIGDINPMVLMKSWTGYASCV